MRQVHMKENNLTQDLREMEATYETKQGVIDGYYNTISDYELNSVRLASGNAEEIAKIENKRYSQQSDRNKRQKNVA